MNPSPSELVASILIEAAKDLSPAIRADVFDAFAEISADHALAQQCRKAAGILREAEAEQLHLFAMVKR